jgi:hypothetical protein
VIHHMAGFGWVDESHIGSSRVVVGGG